MKLGQILKEKQPDEYKKLNNISWEYKRRDEVKQEHLSFSDYENMMRHDSHIRSKGAIYQRTWGSK